ncbi:hypothetical protein QBC42DRAFT_165854 [Cladorrhinum samala]|uniref:Mid2 domain-containing protein n=1 Tax=Cladorrhinum samala TaxID=585594 RepID=A0AAV9I5S8_9PEZI|nr:hypothetical protein QBC42DRAFT_165854 [Cladorrhinum samala]
MGETRWLRQLAVGLGLLLTSVSPSLALPQAGGAGTTVADAPVPWVTINPAGEAETRSPQVITTEGHRSTISQPPSALLSTATYIISPDGRASTYTGLAPVASATGSGDSQAGMFLTCSNTVGLDEPFCLPKRGSTLHPGRTYYITWAPSYFPSSKHVTLSISSPPASDSSSSSSSPSSGGVQGTAEVVLSASGFYAWHIPADYLNSSPSSSSVSVQLSLAYEDDSSSSSSPSSANQNLSLIVVPGPTVFITAAPTASGSSSDDDDGINVIAIAVPIIIVVLLLALLGFCFVKWKRTGRVPLIGAVMSSGSRMGRRMSSRSFSAGYGVGKSKSQRTGTASGTTAVEPGDDRGPYGVGRDDKSETDIGGGGGGVELTDRDSWGTRRSPTSPSSKGRNVFREELERQAREEEAGKR